MTDTIRFRAALCISFFLHFMLLQAHWTAAPSGTGKGERLSREFSSISPLFSDTVAIAIESFSDIPSPDNGADAEQRERLAYLGAVSDAVHANRFISPEANRSLIGLAWFSFSIAADGSFGGIVLTESSGNPVLDRAAEAAVRAASGKVTRPASLGGREIALVMAVKYQYDW